MQQVRKNSDWLPCNLYLLNVVEATGQSSHARSDMVLVNSHILGDHVFRSMHWKFPKHKIIQSHLVNFYPV